MSGLRRFIAGAACPSCGQLDKLFVTTTDEHMACECVACGFREERERGASPGSAEYGKGLGEPASAAVDVVRILEP